MNAPARWIRDLFRKPKARHSRPRPKRLQFEILEDRSVPATYIPLLPVAGTAQTSGINGTPNSAVVYSPEGDAGLPVANRPDAKFVTIMNNSSNVIYPIFYSANSTEDPSNTSQSLYDPKDTLNNTYRGYVGEIVNGQYQLGLQPGHQATIMVPLVFWDGGRVYMVSNGSVPLSSAQDPGNPLQANKVWAYNSSATANTLQGLGPGKSYVVAPASPGDKPLYGANFQNPNSGPESANQNAVVMWYHETNAKAHEFGLSIPAVLTEFTLRDKNQKFIAPNMPVAEQFNINDYDVSYVDSLGMPASMEATDVPSIPPTTGPSQLAWTGSDLSITQMQQAIQAYTTNNTDVATNPNGVNGLGQYFGGLGWDQFYLPGDNNSTASGTITNIININSEAGVTIVTTPGGIKGLVNGGGVTISGVKDQGTGAASALNGTWTVGGVDPINNSFVLANLASDPTKSYDFSAGVWKVSPTTGIHLGKLPSGQNVINLSSNLNSPSDYDDTQYNLVSGGAKRNVGSAKPGLPPEAVATAGSNVIVNVSTDQALLMVPGMIWNTAKNAAGVQLFPTGTAIASIQIGTPGANDSKIVMSTLAAASGSPGSAGPGGVFSFSGSEYGTAATTTSLTGSTSGTNSFISNVDPAVGNTLRRGMTVTGAGIPAGTYVGGVSNGGATVNLVGADLSTPVVPPATTGPYVFSQPGSIVANGNQITNIDPNVGIYLRVGMLVNGPGVAPNGAAPAGFTGNWAATQTFISAISADFKTVTLSQSIGSTASAGPFTFLGAPNSYVVRTLVNNWYAWADYYVNQLAAGGANEAPTGTFTATATGNTDVFHDYGTIVLTKIPTSFDMNKLRVGDVVTSQGTTLNPNPTLAAGQTYDPSLNYTIVNFDQVARTVELSLPVSTAITTPTTDTYTFSAPQFVVRSGDAPAATGASITGVDNANGVTITTTSTARLVNNQEVVISGVTGTTSVTVNGTPTTISINGTWTVQVLNGTQFKLVGSAGNGGAASTGPASKWTATAGTLPYTLNFSVPTNALNPGNISNVSGQPITITASTVGLSTGQQISITGVTDTTSGLPAAINGLWTVKVIDANHFQLVGLTSKGDLAKGGIVGDGHALSGGSWSPENALQFAQTLYDTMQSFSLLIDPTKYSSRSTQLLSYIIGGNTGTFFQNDDPSGPVFPITQRHTMLPDHRTAFELRDQIKSLLRGVYDFTVVSDQAKWYPNPATPTADATLNGAPINFGVYNLDPYVYFIHKVLYNSSYGFSFDDDVANVNTKNSNNLEIAVGGNADTAPGAVNALTNPEAFTQGAMWGTLTQPAGDPPAYIDLTSSHAKDPTNAGQTTITGLNESIVARLTASNPAAGDAPGAFITSNVNGLLPAGVTVEKITALPTQTGAISAIDNTAGQPVKISTTADIGNLGIGDVVTISGVAGRAEINDSWVVKAVVKNPAPGTSSFELDYSVTTGQSITGDGSAITSLGAWKWLPSYVTFRTPKTWTPPTKDSPATFTFSGFFGTTVPDNIAPSVSQSPAGSTITVNGTGFTGAYGVSFNGYPGKIIGTPTDTSIQVEVPDYIPNSDGTTYPGPKGKIAVRNQSGIQYSATDFTIAAATGPTVTANTANRAQNAPTLVINGTGFDATTPGNNTVVFDNGAVGTVTAATATQLTVTFSNPPASLGSLSAVVTANGQSSGSPVQVATIVAPPTVTQTTTSQGQNAPTVVITGTGFDPTAAGNTVAFNLGAVGTVTAATATQLTVTFSTTPTSLGTLTAVVTSFGGASGAPVQVATIVSVAPTVTANTTNRAQNATTLVISGTGFSTTPANNTVVFNNGAVGTVTAATATQLTVTFSTAPTALGSLTAVVTTGGQSSGSPVQVATVVAAPTVTANTANLAQSATAIVINGTGFDTTAAGNTAAFNLGAVGTVTAATATQLTVTFTTKPTSLGNLTAVVTSFGGTSGAATQVATVVAAPPTVTANTVNRAQNATTLVINGTGFSTTPANNTVAFNLGAAGTVTAATATQLTVTFTTTPTALGSLTAVVTTGGQTSGAPTQVATVVAAPTVTANTANRPQSATTIVINGTGFNPTAAGNTVAFNLGAVGTVTAATATQLTVTFSTKPTSLGSLTAVVTSNGGTSGAAVQVATVVTSKTPNQIYVDNAYLLLLGRPADAGAAGWVTMLDTGTPPGDVVAEIANGSEHLRRVVVGLYQQYLGRSADAGYLDWVAFLQKGVTVEAVSAGILASPEFQSNHPTNTNYVDALYTKVLDRTGGPSEVNAWVTAMNNGTSRASAATGFVHSTDYRHNLVREYYTTYLGRSPSDAELTAWLDALNAGTTDQQLIAGIFGSPEGYAKWSV